MPKYTFILKFETPDQIPFMEFKGVAGWTPGRHGAIIIDNIAEAYLEAVDDVTLEVNGEKFSLSAGDGVVIDTRKAGLEGEVGTDENS